MTYTEIKDKLEKCEIALTKLRDGHYGDISTPKNMTYTKKLEVLKEVYTKQLEETGERAYDIYNNSKERVATVPLTPDEAKELDRTPNAKVKQVKEAGEEQEIYSKEQLMQLANLVGPLLKNALQQDNSDVSYINSYSFNPQDSSFILKAQFKVGSNVDYPFKVENSQLTHGTYSITPVDKTAAGTVEIRKDQAEKNLYKMLREMDHQPSLEERIANINKQFEGAIKGINEGTELYDSNGINIKRFSGGQKGVMVQITYGNGSIQVPAEEFPILARAVQSVIGDLKDMSTQYPRKNNIDEHPNPDGTVKEDLDIGHQDDEPHMLKQHAYDIAQYAAKLYKQLDKYDMMKNEIDFPNWWQSKIILARDYISKAQHYLEYEEKEPAINALALEENKNKNEERRSK